MCISRLRPARSKQMMLTCFMVCAARNIPQWHRTRRRCASRPSQMIRSLRLRWRNPLKWLSGGAGCLPSIDALAHRRRGRSVFDHRIYAAEQNRKSYPIVSVSIGYVPRSTAMPLRIIAAKTISHPAAKSLSPFL